MRKAGERKSRKNEGQNVVKNAWQIFKWTCKKLGRHHHHNDNCNNYYNRSQRHDDDYYDGRQKGA